MIDNEWKSGVNARLGKIETNQQANNEQLKTLNQTVSTMQGSLSTMQGSVSTISASTTQIAAQLGGKADKHNGSGGGRTSIVPAMLKAVPKKWRFVALILGAGGVGTGIINWDALAKLFGG